MIRLLKNSKRSLTPSKIEIIEMTEENKELIDECFYCEEQRWGTWNSYDLERKCIITSLTKEECIRATRFYLKAKQEGKFENDKVYSGSVEGKL
jgi:hypothetical protein